MTRAIILLLSSIAAPLFALTSVNDYQITQSPSAVMVTFANGPASRGFSWQTDRTVTESEVRLVAGTATASPEDFLSTPLIYTGTYVAVSAPEAYSHKVIVTGLQPGTVYSYRLGGGGHYVYGSTEVKNVSDKMTIVNLNDAQLKDYSKIGWWPASLAASVRQIGSSSRADFIINGGDLFDKNLIVSGQNLGTALKWGITLEQVADYYIGVPFVSSSGNHDYSEYGNRMPIEYPTGLVGCESLDYGNVHIATIPNTGNDTYSGYVTYLNWLEADLAANVAKGTTTWRIVCVHWGPNTTGDHAVVSPGAVDLAKRLGGICASNKVDLVLQAHDHSFSKTLPYRWSGSGWTSTANDSSAVNLTPATREYAGETWDLDPKGTYYLSCGCSGHRVGEATTWANLDGAKPYTTRSPLIMIGKIAVDSKWGNVGDPASSDLGRSMFGVINIDGPRLSYDFYMVDSTDGSHVLYDKLRIVKTADAVGWANAISSSTTIDQARDATWKLTLPAQGHALPAGATVKISSIAVGERTSGNEQPARLRVYTGESTYVDSDPYDGYARSFGRLGNQGTAVRKLEYSFPSDLTLTVGTTYDIKPLNENGVEHATTPGGSDGSYCGAALVAVPGGALTMNGHSSTHSLIYAIKGQVVSNSAKPGWTAQLSTDASALSFTQDLSGNLSWAKISVSDDSTLNLSGALSGGYATVTLDVAADKTLTLSETTISATTIEVTGGGMVSLAANNALNGTIVGNGTIRYTSGKPSGLTIGEGWCGTVKLSDTSTAFTDINPNDYGNPISVVAFNGIQGYSPSGRNFFYPCVDFENNGGTAAFRISNGYSDSESIFTAISGSGTIYDNHNTTGATHLYRFYDVSEWSGSIARGGAYGKRFVFGTGAANSTYGTITISDDATVTLASSAQLGASGDNGVYVNGTLDVTAASFNNKVLGAGAVVCTGKLPSGTYTNAAWTGTLSLRDIPRQWPLSLNNYASDNSSVEVNGVGAANASSSTGEYLANGKVAKKLVLTDAGIALTDGISYYISEIGELAGSGTLSQSKNGIFQGVTINVMTNFSGTLNFNEMTVTFGTKTRAGRDSSQNDTEYKGKLYIDSDAVLSVPAGFALWSPAAVVIDGTVNFTTDQETYENLTLFTNMGSSISFLANSRITVNGDEIDWTKHQKKIIGTSLVLMKKRIFAVRFK